MDFEKDLIELLNKEVEDDRLEALKGSIDLINSGFEVLDRTSIIQSNFTDFVLNHSFVLKDANLYKMAYVVEYLLVELYSAIGQKIGEEDDSNQNDA